MCYESNFDDLEAAIEGVHAHFEKCFETADMQAPPAEALCRLRLAMHEWLANLVRHAHFGERAPEVHVRIWKRAGQLHCVIEDNSDGFDLESQLAVQKRADEQAHALPERGMGLLLLKASTERLAYTPVEEAANRLALRVPLDRSASDTSGPVSTPHETPEKAQPLPTTSSQRAAA